MDHAGCVQNYVETGSGTNASDGPLRYYDIQAVHGYYLTTKAYNARIVMMWLATKCQQ
ncbi:unnamed protein product, partial [Symbiodinium sp. KB8]